MRKLGADLFAVAIISPLQRPLLCTVKFGIIQGDFTRVIGEGTHGSTFLDQRLLPADTERTVRPLLPRAGAYLAMKETQPDELFAAWLTLSDNQRNEMDAQFRDIFELTRR